MHFFARILQVQPDARLATLIADRIATQLHPLIEKELAAMSATLAEAVSALKEAEQRAATIIAAKDAAIADLTAKLAAATAGDPAVIADIDGVTSALAAIDPDQPAG